MGMGVGVGVGVGAGAGAGWQRTPEYRRAGQMAMILLLAQ